MKKLYLIGGTMGVGKTTTGQLLKRKLNDSVFLDGDWCWDMDPFQVTEETKAMVMGNIAYLLNRFIQCTAYRNIIFVWVMHEQTIIDEITNRLNLENCQTHLISLICDEAELQKRLHKDIRSGIRQEDIVSRSSARLSLYKELNTIKIDVTDLNPEKTADQIIEISI